MLDGHKYLSMHEGNDIVTHLVWLSIPLYKGKARDTNLKLSKLVAKTVIAEPFLDEIKTIKQYRPSPILSIKYIKHVFCICKLIQFTSIHFFVVCFSKIKIFALYFDT